MNVRIFLIFATFAVILISVTQAGYTENSIKEKNDLQDVNLTKCNCGTYSCGCCEHVELQFIKIDAIVCSNITYLPNDYGISLIITYNSYTVFNDTISVRNPPPYCIGQPFIEYLEAELCVKLHNIDFDKHHVYGCVRIVAKLYKYVIAKYEVGCFNIGHHNNKNVNVSNMFKTFFGKLDAQNPVVNMI